MFVNRKKVVRFSRKVYLIIMVGFFTVYFLLLTYFHDRLFPQNNAAQIRNLLDLEEVMSHLEQSPQSRNLMHMAETEQRIQVIEERLKNLGPDPLKNMKGTLEKIDSLMSHTKDLLNEANYTTDLASTNHTQFWNMQPLSSQRGPPTEDMWLLDSTPKTTSISSIPKNIYKIYLQKSGYFPVITDIPEEIKNAHNSWIKNNPGYKMYYFDLAISRRYLAKHFHPVFLHAFDCIESFDGKSNLLRLAIIYREGGWYSDWKQVCLQPSLLSSLSGTDGVFFEKKKKIMKEYSLQNAFFGAMPRDDVIALAIKYTFGLVHRRSYGDNPTETAATEILDRSFRMKNEQRKKEGRPMQYAGFYDKDDNALNFYFGNNAVVKHICDNNNCDVADNSMEKNKDYDFLHKNRMYYCESAWSIFT